MYAQKVKSREHEKSFKFQTHNYQPANNKGKETSWIMLQYKKQIDLQNCSKK